MPHNHVSGVNANQTWPDLRNDTIITIAKTAAECVQPISPRCLIMIKREARGILMSGAQICKKSLLDGPGTLKMHKPRSPLNLRPPPLPLLLHPTHRLLTMASNSSWVPDEDSQTLFSERCWLQGVVISAIAYGVTVSLYFLSFYLRVRDQNRVEFRKRLPLLAYITISFLLGTIFMIALAAFTQMAFIDDRNYPGGPNAYENNMFSIPIDNTGNVVFVLSNWLSDALVVSDSRIRHPVTLTLKPGMALQSNLPEVQGPSMDHHVLPLPAARGVGRSVHLLPSTALEMCLAHLTNECSHGDLVPDPSLDHKPVRDERHQFHTTVP